VKGQPSRQQDGDERAASSRPGLTAVISQAEVKHALSESELVLHYQPIVMLASGQPVGVEALLRWQHPDGGLLGPDEFLPAVLHTPAMTAVTEWVLQTALRAAGLWPEWKLSLNVTARDLGRPDFVDVIAAALADSDTPADRVTLELTETSLVHDLEHAATTLRGIRDLGVGIALDDFGTGYSSMLYLRELPLTELKLDRVFVAGIERDGDDLAIVSSTMALARSTGLTVVAEGVETPGQALRLHDLGCAYAQGYLWSEPRTTAHTDLAYDKGRLAATPPEASREPAQSVLAHASAMLEQGASLHTIAAALNRAGLHTSRGTSWRAATVARLLQGMPEQ
jgi:EAL domain-containing protein (putative c-di-GMP-specific phosphodiesterase class I)